MKYLRLLKKLSNALFIPTLIAVVCTLIFKDELNTLEYADAIRYFLIVVCIITLIEPLIKNKNEKNN